MRGYDFLVGVIFGSVAGLFVAQYLSSLPSWQGTTIFAACYAIPYCSYVMPIAVTLALILSLAILYIGVKRTI